MHTQKKPSPVGDGAPVFKVLSNREDDATRHLSSLHAVVDRLEVLERFDRDLSLHLAANSKVKS